MSQITSSFWSEEFVVSDSYPQLAKDIILTNTDLIKLSYLCRIILQPAKNMISLDLGCTIVFRILSGKRSTKLNAMVGGAATSDHLYNYDSVACDFQIIGDQDSYTAKKVIEHIQSQSLAFGQLIWYPKRRFIHVSLASAKHQGQYLEKS